jgi:hypothetical protein
MPLVEFEPAISASERPHAYALFRTFTEIGQVITAIHILILVFRVIIELANKQKLEGAFQGHFSLSR